MRVVGTWLIASEPEEGFSYVRTLTVQIDNLPKLKPVLHRTDAVPQVLEFTANVTGSPKTTCKLRWSLIQTNTFGNTVLSAERDFSVLIDRAGCGTYHGECVLFANEKTEVAGSDHTSGQQRTNWLFIVAQNGAERPLHSQSFRATAK